MLDPDILENGFEEYRRFVNPLIANRAMLAGEPRAIVGTEDGRIVDADGKQYEDFHGTQTFGHRRKEIADGVREYLDGTLPSWFPARVSPLAGRFARRLHERTGYDNAFFGMSGSDAVEAAIKLGRALTLRPGIVCVEGAYHGCNVGSVSMMATGLFSDSFAPHLPGVVKIPFGDVGALEAALSKGDVGTLFVEPIQGEGGVRVLPAAFVEAACTLTERHGTLLVADEVQTGIGRTGHGFLATADWPRRPDVVLLAKALGGGLIPVSAMLTARAIFERAYGAHFAAGESHNLTFSFNSVGMAAGLATLDLVTDELLAEVKDKGDFFRSVLEESLASSPLVEEIRGEGMMLGLKLNDLGHPWLTFEHFGFPQLADRSAMSPLLCHRMYRRGFFCFTCGHDWSVFRLQPRLEIDRETLASFAKIIREEIDYLEELG